MNLEVEFHPISRVIEIDVNDPRIAKAYGRYSESLEDEDFDELVDLIQQHVKDAIEFEITNVRMGYQRHKRPWLTREAGE